MSIHHSISLIFWIESTVVWIHGPEDFIIDSLEVLLSKILKFLALGEQT